MKIKSIIYCAVVVLGVTACGSKASKMQMPTPHITVVEAYKKELPTRIKFVGKTRSPADVVIQPRVSGYLISKHYDSGLPVKKGQLLFTLDSAPMKVEVAKAEAMVASTNSQLVEAQHNYDRAVPLARINAISQSSLDQATARLATAEANLQSAETVLRSAELNLSYTTIYAPMDGIIGSTRGSEGDYVGMGTNNPILNTISKVDSLTIMISLPMTKYRAILKRDNIQRPSYENYELLSDIEIVFPDNTVYPHKGIYGSTETYVSSQTGSIMLNLYFANPERHLIPGQFVYVYANVGANKEVVLVPQRAVMQSQGTNSVYVMGQDSTVYHKAVKLGDTYGTEWEILEGVSAGEMVLTEGLQKVRSKMKIVPIVKPAATNSAKGEPFAIKTKSQSKR